MLTHTSLGGSARDLHFVLLMVCDHELTVYVPHKTFKERALDSGHFEISLFSTVWTPSSECVL